MMCPYSARRRTSLGTGFATMAAFRTYGYDAAGRLQSLSHDLGGTTADQSLGFGYNAASQIVTRAGTNDGLVSNSAYPVSRSYAVNGLNQYTAAGPATFAYDLNGNLTSDGSTNYVYDAENRLVSASGAHAATLSYDPLGRLWQVAAPSGTTRFVYDGDHIAIEYDGTGSLLRAYVYGPGADEPLVWYEANSATARRYLHTDHQGSIVLVSDQYGNPLASSAYDPWGIPNAGGVGFTLGAVGRFGYTGQAWLPELGLYYYKARIYSPTLGRFLQTDPEGYDDQINLYAYVGNDPVNMSDPSGLDTRVSLRGFPIGQLGGQTWDHMYVRYEDTETGEARISRSGPQPDYDGSLRGAALNDGGDSEQFTVDTLESQSFDRPELRPGTEEFMTVVIPVPFPEVYDRVNNFGDQVNDAHLPWDPQGPNSNSYAEDLFEDLTGQRPSTSDSDVWYFGASDHLGLRVTDAPGSPECDHCMEPVIPR